MSVWVVEQRWEDDGRIERRLRHLASSQADAETWIDSHPDLHEEDYWFALWEQPVDQRAHEVPPHQFYTREAEKIEQQPINRDAEDRRAEQGGLSTDVPGQDDTVP